MCLLACVESDSDSDSIHSNAENWGEFQKMVKQFSPRKPVVAVNSCSRCQYVSQVEASSSAARAKQTSDSESFLECSPACARLPLLPISMPHIDSAAIAAQAPAAGAAGIASAVTSSAAHAPARLAAHISGVSAGTAAAAAVGGSAPEAADLCAAYSFSALTLSKPLDAFADGVAPMGDAAGARVALDAEGGMAGAAMATFESLGAKISGSAGSAFGGVGLNVTAVQEQLGHFGGSFSSVLGQPGGANSSSFFNSSFFGSAFRSGAGAKQ
jgi:hypothetical protein